MYSNQRHDGPRYRRSHHAEDVVVVSDSQLDGAASCVGKRKLGGFHNLVRGAIVFAQLLALGLAAVGCGLVGFGDNGRTKAQLQQLVAESGSELHIKISESMGKGLTIYLDAQGAVSSVAQAIKEFELLGKLESTAKRRAQYYAHGEVTVQNDSRELKLSLEQGSPLGLLTGLVRDPDVWEIGVVRVDNISKQLILQPRVCTLADSMCTERTAALVSAVARQRYMFEGLPQPYTVSAIMEYSNPNLAGEESYPEQPNTTGLAEKAVAQIVVETSYAKNQGDLMETGIRVAGALAGIGMKGIGGSEQLPVRVQPRFSVDYDGDIRINLTTQNASVTHDDDAPVLEILTAQITELKRHQERLSALSAKPVEIVLRRDSYEKTFVLGGKCTDTAFGGDFIRAVHALIEEDCYPTAVPNSKPTP